MVNAQKAEEQRLLALEAAREGLSVKSAAARAGVVRETVSHWKQKDPEYKAKYEAAERDAVRDSVVPTAQDVIVLGIALAAERARNGEPPRPCDYDNAMKVLERHDSAWREVKRSEVSVTSDAVTQADLLRMAQAVIRDAEAAEVGND